MGKSHMALFHYAVLALVGSVWYQEQPFPLKYELNVGGVIIALSFHSLLKTATKALDSQLDKFSNFIVCDGVDDILFTF